MFQKHIFPRILIGSFFKDNNRILGKSMKMSADVALCA